MLLFLSPRGVSYWPEKTAVIQVIVLVQASHLWVKYLFFSNMMFCWCMSWSGSVQVYNRLLTGLQGISEGIVFAFSSWKPTKWNSCLSSLIIFSLCRFKKTYCFQLFHRLKFTDYLLKLNKCKRLFRIYYTYWKTKNACCFWIYCKKYQHQQK